MTNYLCYDIQQIIYHYQYKYIFDICSYHTIWDYLKCNSCDFEESIINIIQNDIKNNTIKNDDNGKIINIFDLQKGDKIKIDYCPYSQKYIDDYPSIIGTVIAINLQFRDVLIYYIENNTCYIKSLQRESCGNAYCNSNGYDVIIQKLSDN